MISCTEFRRLVDGNVVTQGTAGELAACMCHLMRCTVCERWLEEGIAREMQTNSGSVSEAALHKGHERAINLMSNDPEFRDTVSPYARKYRDKQQERKDIDL